MPDISFAQGMAVVTAVGGICAFLWSVYQFRTTQLVQAEARRFEARKPFLERQLDLYQAATEAAATLSISTSADELSTAKSKFLLLYWGKLGMVEDLQVEKAMVNFRSALDDGSPQKVLESLSLELAHACRNSLADSWKIHDWKMQSQATVSNTLKSFVLRWWQCARRG